MYIGFDLGYGYAKLCYGRDYQYRVFPSVLTKAEEFEHGGKGFDNYKLEIDGQNYYIGHAAINSKSKILLSAFEGDRLNSDTYKKLFMAGLASCAKDDTDLSIVTGLPINAYKVHKQDIEKYKGRHEVVLDGRWHEINITSIKCIPQPLGTYFKLLPAYPELKNQSILIVDIGFKTTDLLRIEKDRPLASSVSLNLGMSDVARKVVNWVNGKIDGRTWTINEIDELLDNGYVRSGMRMTVPLEITQPALKDVYNGIWSRVVEHFPEYGTLDRIIFTGGSSIRFKPFIGSMQLDSMAVSSDSQLANAIGYREVLEWSL